MDFGEEKAARIRSQFEFIIKCVLYINGANADVYWHDDRPQLEAQLKRAENAGKRRKLEQKLSKAKGVFKVGYKIVLSREEKEMYDGVSTGKWQLSSRFIVQGHFRNQPYGEGRSSRKLIFIEPFWKGPEYAEVVNKQHLIK
jgi:hypothetical protein